jgi:site-specific DNA recombinase
LFVEEVAVGDNEIRLRGPKAALAKVTLADGLPPAGGVVPSFVRQWRPVGDSNPCYRRERAVS